ELTPLAQRAQVKMAINSAIVTYLPLLMAIDKGYFARAGIDIQEQPFNTSATSQLPLLARGDLDLAPVVPAPATYNQLSQGFNVQVIAAFSAPKPGRVSDSWLSVRSDLVDQIKALPDLKGKTVEGAVEGSPIALLAIEAIRKSNLSAGQDVQLTYRIKGPADMLAIAQSKGADVIGMTEPTASQAEQQGIAKRWLTYSDLAPWYQSLLVGASSQFLQTRPEVAQKFLEVYVLAAREVNATNGAWTDDLLNLMSKRAGVDGATLKAQGGVPYYDPNVLVSTDSLTNTQQIWLRENQVKQAIEVQQLVNPRPLEQALQVVGRG
ncbi:MAG TPA: ABC transporter substrate-binding protein, partial [Chloroflexota bacterium]